MIIPARFSRPNWPTATGSNSRRSPTGESYFRFIDCLSWQPQSKTLRPIMGGNVWAYRGVGVSAFAKHHQLRRDLLVTIAVPKSSLTSPDADTPIRRYADPPTRFPSGVWNASRR